jgi:hypothetical protein
MSHWYREPKRVKLMEHLERAGISFVLSSDGFAESDLLKLKAAVSTAIAKKLVLGTGAEGDPRKVLVIAPQNPDANWLSNAEPWAGIFVLPAHRLHREQALQAIFVVNRSFKNGARGLRPISMGIVHRFVLDMRTPQASFYRIRGVDGS